MKNLENDEKDVTLNENDTQVTPAEEQDETEENKETLENEETLETNVEQDPESP